MSDTTGGSFSPEADLDWLPWPPAFVTKPLTNVLLADDGEAILLDDGTPLLL